MGNICRIFLLIGLLTGIFEFELSASYYDPDWFPQKETEQKLKEQQQNIQKRVAELNNPEKVADSYKSLLDLSEDQSRKIKDLIIYFNETMNSILTVEQRKKLSDIRSAELQKQASHSMAIKSRFEDIRSELSQSNPKIPRIKSQKDVI